MAFEIRRFGVVLAVAILFAIFVFSLADAVTPRENYPDYCQQSQYDRYYSEPLMPYKELNCSELPVPSQEQIDACPGRLVPEYAAGRCAETYECDCQQLVDAYNNKKENIRFWVAVILGFAAMAGGLLLPQKHEVSEWIGGGLILGGVITLFIATAIHWNEIHKIVRPIVIAGELILVIWLAYRRLAPKKKR